MKFPRTWPVHLAACFVLAGSLASFRGFDPFREGVWGDMATHLMQAQSIAFDRDLRYGAEDAARWHAADAPVKTGPRGLYLVRATDLSLRLEALSARAREAGTAGARWHYSFGFPFLYALAGAPLVATFGARGLLVVNAVMLALITWILGRWWARRGNAVLAAVFALAVVGLSLAPAYLYVMQPDLLRPALLGAAMALVLAGLERGRNRGATCRARGQKAVTAVLCCPPISPPQGRWLPLVAGAFLLGLAAYEKPTFAFFPLALIVHLAVRGAGRRLAPVAILTVAGWLVPTAIHLLRDGSVSPYTGDRRQYVRGVYPWAPSEDFQAGRLDEAVNPDGGISRRETIVGAAGLGATLRMAAVNLPLNFFYFFAGRQTGLVAYAPALLVCVLIYLSLPGRGGKAWVVAGILAYLAFYFVLRPTDYFGSATSLGNRNLLHILPAVALLAPRTPRRGWFALGLAPIVLLGAVFLNPVLARPRFAVLGRLNRMKQQGLVWLPVDLTQVPHMFTWPREVVELPDGARLYRVAGTRPSPTLGLVVAPDETVRLVVETVEPAEGVMLRAYAGPGGAVIQPLEGGKSNSTAIHLPPGACRNVTLPIPAQVRVATEDGDRRLCAVSYRVTEEDASGSVPPSAKPVLSGSRIALGLKPPSPPEEFAVPDGTIDLGAEGDQRHLLWGWTAPLTDRDKTRFRAADGLEAFVLVHLPPRRGGYTLEIEGRAYEEPALMAVIVGDAVALGRRELPTTWTTIRVSVPEALVDEGVTTIRLWHANLVMTRPTADAGRLRMAAAAYRRITIRPAGWPAANTED